MVRMFLVKKMIGERKIFFESKTKNLKIMFKQFYLSHQRMLLAAAVFLVILFSRVLHIKLFAVDMPWSDQWDGEIERIYFKLIEGTLRIQDFWAQANEHRIILTKILNLISFKLSGDQFNQINALYFQSLIYAAIPAALVYFLNAERIKIKETVFLILVFAPIFDWENAYWSYQSQVYFAILFGVVGMGLVSKLPRSLVGILIVSLFAGCSNGASFYIPLIAMVAVIISAKRDLRTVLEFLAYTSLVILLYKVFTAPIPWHDQFKAESIKELVDSVIRYISWPNSGGFFIWSFLAMLFSERLLFRKINSDVERFGLFLAMYFFIFLSSSIYVRAGFATIPVRYYSYYLIGISAFAFLDYKKSKNATTVFVALISFLYLGMLSKSYEGWNSYASVKRSYQENFIEALAEAHKGLDDKDTKVMQIIQKLPLPYAGYPNYEIPYKIIIDRKSQIIFDHLSSDENKNLN